MILLHPFSSLQCNSCFSTGIDHSALSSSSSWLVHLSNPIISNVSLLLSLVLLHSTERYCCLGSLSLSISQSHPTKRRSAPPCLNSNSSINIAARFQRVSAPIFGLAPEFKRLKAHFLSRQFVILKLKKRVFRAPFFDLARSFFPISRTPAFSA